MRFGTHFRTRLRAGVAGAMALLVALQMPSSATAATLVQISSDPYTNTSSMHKTQVEPDTFANGSTIVSAFQSGRFADGGSSNIGWATSTDNGATWIHGFLPGITTYDGGTFDRVSDPSVAYDAKHNTWMISSLPIVGSSGAAVAVSRSTTGGTAWANPVLVIRGTGLQFLDKDWIACDDTASSPYYGHCYVEWDLPSFLNVIYMSTSTDGGQTWSAPARTANHAIGIGGQPVVQPNGTVIVPIDNAFESNLLAFRSTNGGASWSSTVKVAALDSHLDAGGIRSGPLPSAEIDASGKVYVVWADCRFEASCSANDIVMSTSSDGVTWSAVTRIPIDAVGTGVDHFLPGLGVDKTTSGTRARLGLTFYYYPHTNCTTATCQLDVGFVSSTNGGASWSATSRLAGPMTTTWLANTTQGYMVGDYISTSIAGGTAHPVFALASAPSGSLYHEAMFAPIGGLPLTGGALTTQDDPVLSTTSDYATRVWPATAF